MGAWKQFLPGSVHRPCGQDFRGFRRVQGNPRRGIGLGLLIPRGPCNTRKKTCPCRSRRRTYATLRRSAWVAACLRILFKSIHSTAFLEQLKVQILLLPHSFQHSLTILKGSQTVVLIPVSVSTTSSTRPSEVDLQLGHGSPSGTCRIWNLAREFDDSPAATGVLNGTHHRTERGRVCGRFWFWLSRQFSLGLQLKMLPIGVTSHEDHDATMVYASLAGFMIVVLSLS